jgi:hypothetical protein
VTPTFLSLALLCTSCSLNVFDRSPRLVWENGGRNEARYWNDLLQTELVWVTKIAEFGADDDFGNPGGARCAGASTDLDTSKTLQARLSVGNTPSLADLQARKVTLGKFSSCLDSFERSNFLPLPCRPASVWFHVTFSLRDAKPSEPFDLYLCEFGSTARIFVTRKLLFSDGR